jgi:hypothetical protein
MYITELVKKLLDKKSDFPFVVMNVKDGLGLKIMSFKRKRRWYLDTDLYGYSHFDYSGAGYKRLNDLAVNSQLSDGVQVESAPNSKRVFCLSFDDDTKEGIRYTYEVWLEVIRRVLMEENCVADISTKNSK